MISAHDAVTALGPSLFRVMVPGRTDSEVADVFLAEPSETSVGQRDDLVLGVGLAEAGQALDLLERCVAGDASGLVLRAPLAENHEVREAAQRHGLLLVGLVEGVAWAHVVWMLRGVVDRAAAPDAPVAGDAGVHNDLFVLADAAAAIIDAPVTIEDNQSRVLAYSSGQSLTDTARVSTIVGRRVPPDVVAHFRARGVFRRLARSSEPFLVPEGPDGTKPRLVVPVRAGDEWLGSIWAVVDGPVSAEVQAELTNAASVLALHLLRLRAQANIARRTSAERVRAALRGESPRSPAGAALPPPPWRVVALAAPAPDADVHEQLDLWDATFRRHSWADPLLADVDGTVFAIVTDGSAAGSWQWLAALVRDAHATDPTLRAAAGGPCGARRDLPRSRAEAAEAFVLAGRGAVPVVTFDKAWAEVTIGRAASAMHADHLTGPLTVLLDHDRAHGTDHVATLDAWLRHPGEPQRAAQALHVHVNTLRHRMKRIRELVDLDPGDPKHRLALQLQLEAVRQRSSG